MQITIDKRNHLKIYMFDVVGETHAHDSFELIWFDSSKDIYPSPITHYAQCDTQ